MGMSVRRGVGGSLPKIVSDWAGGSGTGTLGLESSWGSPGSSSASVSTLPAIYAFPWYDHSYTLFDFHSALPLHYLSTSF
jgi:hypothetical protein